MSKYEEKLLTLVRRGQEQGLTVNEFNELLVLEKIVEDAELYCNQQVTELATTKDNIYLI